MKYRKINISNIFHIVNDKLVMSWLNPNGMIAMTSVEYRANLFPKNPSSISYKITNVVEARVMAKIA